jgi:hypothetical protein
LALLFGAITSLAEVSKLRRQPGGGGVSTMTAAAPAVSVAPQEQEVGTQKSYSVEMAGAAPRDVTVDAWNADQLQVRSVVLGNMDRPKTKFIKNQKSHTVAWTLVRHHIASFSGKPLGALLAFLDKSFPALLADIQNPEGRGLAQIALQTLHQHRSGTYPLHDRQPLVSALVRWYFIAYQASESASYVNPDEAERAQGHGEASYMLTLRRNEFILESGAPLADSPEQVAIAATALFDASVTPVLDRQGITNAFGHWREAMQGGFPHILAKEGQNILARMLARQVEGRGAADKAAIQLVKVQSCQLPDSDM